jgi:hypothetical protein
MTHDDRCKIAYATLVLLGTHDIASRNQAISLRDCMQTYRSSPDRATLANLAENWVALARMRASRASRGVAP